MRLRHWLAAACVAAGGPAFAADDVVQLGRYQPPAGGFAGAVQTAARNEAKDAADADDDTVLIHGHRYRRYYGGVSFGYYGRGYGFSYSYYAPRYYSHFRRPVYYARPYYPVCRPTYYVSSWPTVSYTVAPVSYAAPSAPIPAVVNNYYYSTPAPSAAPPAKPMIPPSDSIPRYDGGPTNPVPQPAPDAPKPMPAPNTNNVKISAPKSPPNKYPAYGEK